MVVAGAAEVTWCVLPARGALEVCRRLGSEGGAWTGGGACSIYICLLVWLCGVVRPRRIASATSGMSCVLICVQRAASFQDDDYAVLL